MANAIAKARRRWTPLNLTYSRQVSGALNQNYDANYQAYDPDRSLVPLDILFTVKVTDPKGVIDSGVINSKLTDVRWYENVVDDAHSIQDDNTSYVIDRHGSTDGRGKITVKKNTPLEGIVLIFTAKYSDPRNGKVVNVNATISLGVTISTDEPLRVKVDYPYGQVVDPTEQRDIIEVDNTLFMGDHEYEGAIYWWQRKNGSDYDTLEEGQDGITGVFSGKLNVPCPTVGKRMDLRCIADALPDLTGVNLISKAMISDDWNNIIAGLTILGEDSDGKYWSIKQFMLYSAFNKGTEDIFGGKIKYKTNQRYRLDIKWKLADEQDGDGLILILRYTNSTSDIIRLLKGQTSLEFKSFTSPAGKTISKITATYGAGTSRTKVYDIQLVEYDGANSIATGGSNLRIPANGVASGNEMVKFTILDDVSAQLTPGTSVTLSIEDVEVLAGSMDYLTVNLYSGTTKTTGKRIYLSTRKLTFEIGSTADSTSPRIHVYGGAYDNMKGNAVKIRGLMLSIGDKAYKYCPAVGEFIPALSDGAPRPDSTSGRAITTNHVLSTQYPRCNAEIVAPSLILDDTSLFGASVVLHSNRGDVIKPELYWSFPWKDKTGTIFNRGSKIFIDEDQFDNEEFDYSVDPVEGLDEAKWAANLNGIDQLLYVLGHFGDNSATINKRHVIEFILNSDIVNPCYLFDYHFIQSTDDTNKRRVTLRMVDGNKLQVMVKNKDVSLLYLTGNLALQKDRLYRCELQFNSSGQLKVMILNGMIITTTTTGTTLSTESTRLGIGGYATPYSNFVAPIKVLKYEFWSSPTYLYLLYDFQPESGDRSKMLANKGQGLNFVLTTVNAPDINEVDPANGFFITI